jgi:hypothetical protein
MKLTTQLTVVICVGALGMAGLVLGLAVWADWSDGAVVGLCTVFGTIVVNLIVAIRNQQKTAETLADQDQKLDTVVAQTNGLSERERQEVARQAVLEAFAQLKTEGHL